MKRFLECNSSEFNWMTGKELLDAIAGSEGRILLCETFGVTRPMLGDITNAEFAASMGSDLLLLNLFDVNKPTIQGLPKTNPKDSIRKIKLLTGRPVGVNLEPAPVGRKDPVNPWALTEGRTATLTNVEKLHEMGNDFIVLTGNPGNGIRNEAILNALHKIRSEFKEEVILAAGKMHGSGILSETGENIITKEDVKAFIQAGAHIILLPAPGTLPGITTEYVKGLVSLAHSMGALTITAVGTSQEGADTSTIKEIALMSKMTGTDIHHLGDSGYMGMPSPENILAYSIAIRGVRHTYHRMAASIRR